MLCEPAYRPSSGRVGQPAAPIAPSASLQLGSLLGPLCSPSCSGVNGAPIWGAVDGCAFSPLPIRLVFTYTLSKNSLVSIQVFNLDPRKQWCQRGLSPDMGSLVAWRPQVCQDSSVWRSSNCTHVHLKRLLARIRIFSFDFLFLWQSRLLLNM